MTQMSQQGHSSLFESMEISSRVLSTAWKPKNVNFFQKSSKFKF